MEANLVAGPGRVFVGELEGRVRMVTVLSVRRRRSDGTPSSARVVWESNDGEVRAEASLTLPKDGVMRGFRRVTVARYGLASQLAKQVGESIPTDAFTLSRSTV